MVDIDNLYRIKLLDNYVSNVDKILEEVYLHPPSAFKTRSEESEFYRVKTICGKGATMYSIMYHFFSPRLKELCVETVDFGKFPHPDEIVINKYPPGSYLGKHRDGAGKYWKFQLIFLKSTKSHFTWYDREDNAHLVEEIPGRGLEMPVNIVHESTVIAPDEEDKYSMVFIWR